MAASNSPSAPSTHGQPSRKTKRAWRKNVDLTEVQTGLESARDQFIQTGGQLLADLPADALFQTDIEGSALVKAQARKAHPGLKVDEILARRSAVPAVSARKTPTGLTDGLVVAGSKRKRGNGVSHAELQRLKEVAYGGEKVHKNVVNTEGVATHDPWAEQMPVVVLPTQTYIDAPQVLTAPKTLKHAPISLTATGKVVPHVARPAAGRSYNPSFADWTHLLKREGNKEIAAEEKRLADAQLEAERLARVAKAAEEAELEAAREAAASEYDESEWEGIQSEIEDAELRRKRPERMTPAERNKAKRRKVAERLEKHEKRTRERDEQLKRVTAIKRDLDMKVATRRSASQEAIVDAKFPGSVESEDEADDEEDTSAALRRRKFGKVAVPDAPLEVVLADELQESLRLLKPEGNLLRDRYRNMLVQGRVEARKAIQQPKRAKTKVTEKWSYKDWKLN